MTEPIAGHALLSDCQGSALVSRSGSVGWACLARFDIPSTFGPLLGPDAGHISLTPVGGHTTTRSYLADAMALHTDESCRR